jgi:outer membrane protein, heavy metal efflux system
MSTVTGGPDPRATPPRGLPARIPVALCFGLAAWLASPVGAQDHQPLPRTPGAVDPLEALVAEAVASHPQVQAAVRRVEAARSRVPQAGALSDPMVSAGLQNLPVSSLNLSEDGMTMLALHVEQRLPPPGLRAAREAAARAGVEEAEALAEVARWDVTTRLGEAYFQLLLVEEAEEVHHRTHAALGTFAAAAETAYAQGMAPQADILRAQTELEAIHEHLSELRQLRSAALAEINTLLDRDSRSPVAPTVPHRLAQLLESDPDPGFLSFSLVAPELGGGFATLPELEARAMTLRPEVALARHRTEAARHREDVAIRDRRPGVAISGGYGVRSARSDLLSLGVSMEFPLFRSRKQDRAIEEAQEERRAQELDGEAVQRVIRRDVADAHAELVRVRERLLLLDEAVIPQARAAVESLAAAYRSGAASFTGLIQAQTVLYRHEIELAHLTAEVGRRMVRLEWAIGAELIREELP